MKQILSQDEHRLPSVSLSLCVYCFVCSVKSTNLEGSIATTLNGFLGHASHTTTSQSLVHRHEHHLYASQYVQTLCHWANMCGL